MTTTAGIGQAVGVAPTYPRNLYDELIPYEWMYVQMHNSLDDSATQAYDRAFGTAGQTTALFTSGLTTFVGGNPDWATNPGFWTPDGSNYQRVSTEVLRAFVDFSTLTSGGMLIMFRIAVTDPTPTSTEYVFSHSDLASAEGGFAVFLTAVGEIFVTVKGQGVSPANICNFGTVMTTDIEYAYCIYIDLLNDDGYIFRDGVAGNQSTNNIPTPYPIMDVTKGLCIGARSGAVANNKLNQNGSGVRIRDLMMLRVTSDIASDVGTIAQQYSDNVGDIPRKLIEDFL